MTKDLVGSSNSLIDNSKLNENSILYKKDQTKISGGYELHQRQSSNTSGPMFKLPHLPTN